MVRVLVARGAHSIPCRSRAVAGDSITRTAICPGFRLAVAGVAVLLTLTGSVWADPPVTTSVPSALDFARRDAARMASAVPQLSERVAAAAQAVAEAEKGAAAAVADKAALEKSLAESAERLPLLQALKAAADKAAQTADMASKSAGNKPGDLPSKSANESSELAAAVTRLLDERNAARKAAEARMPDMEKKIQETAAAIKPLTEARQAVDKLVAEVNVAVKQSAERAAAFEIAVPKPDPKQIHLLRTYTHGRQIMSCLLDPSAEVLYGGADDNTIQRWDLFTGLRTELKGHGSWVGSLAWLPQPPMLLSGGYEGKLLWWDPVSTAGQPIRTTAAHKGFIRAVAVSRDGRFVATSGNDQRVRVWSGVDGALIADLSGHESHVYNIAFHPDGRHLISGDLMGGITQWEIEGWKPVRKFDAKTLETFDKTFVAHCGGIRAIDFSPDGKSFAVGGIGNVTNAFAGVGTPTVLIFDWAEGKLLQTLNPTETFTGSVWGLKYHPSGEFLMAAGGGGGGGALWIWKPDQPKSMVDFKLPQAARGLQLHPDGLRFAIPLFDGTVRVYDLAPAPPAK